MVGTRSKKQRQEEARAKKTDDEAGINVDEGGGGGGSAPLLGRGGAGGASPRTVRVVILGGGFAGRRCLRMLRAHRSPHVRVEPTLVDAKDFFEYTPSTLRCMVEPSHASFTTLPQPTGTVIGSAVGIDEQRPGAASAVRLDNGQSLPCDYVLMCTGSSYISPVKPASVTHSSLASRRQELQDASRTMQDAVNILIVGGGFVGVELAAEIVGRYGKTKKVSLVSADDTLLPRMRPSVGQYAEAWLERRGCKVFCGETILEFGKLMANASKLKRQTVQTDSGREFNADIVYMCAGFKPNTDVLQGDNKSKSRDERTGFACVADTLRVVGYDNVFATGDCMLWNDEKNAMNADVSATLACRNVIRLAEGADASVAGELLQYPQGVCYGRSTVPLIAVLSLYKYHAVMQFNWLVVSGPLATLMKYVIEFLQIHTARENAFLSAVWNVCEHMSLLAARYVIT